MTEGENELREILDQLEQKVRAEMSQREGKTGRKPPEAGIEIRYNFALLLPPCKGEFSLQILQEVPIGVIKVFPGIQFELFDSIMTERLKGIVIETFGAGNIPGSADALLPIIRKASDNGIRFSSIGIIAAAVGGFLSDYYGNTGKPLWSCLLVIFRIALFPVLFCVTFCLEGGIVSMGIGLMLSQILAIAVFYGFVLVQKGSEMIPYMIDDPDCEKVYMNSFDYNEEEYGRICGWMRDQLTAHGTDAAMTAEAETVFRAICKKTEENNRGKAVCGECVLRFIDEPEIIIKDNGALFDPDMKDERVRYHVLLACNSCTIHLGRKLMTA